LTGLGLGSEQAEDYDEKLRAGKVMLAAQTENDEQTRLVRDIFENGGAEELVITGERPRVEAAPRLREEKWEKW